MTESVCVVAAASALGLVVLELLELLELAPVVVDGGAMRGGMRRSAIFSTGSTPRRRSSSSATANAMNVANPTTSERSAALLISRSSVARAARR